MLELKNIRKVYRIGEVETRAVDGITVSFREQEFVAVLGESGSGKTTFLNIIGGLDRYDEGELIIKGKSTKNFKEREWDAYRNNSVGFVFQSYNLISHLSIVTNVELGMTLSGVSREEKHGAGHRSAGAGRAEGASAQEAQPAFRRTDAARSHRPRAGQRPRNPAL